MTRTRSGRSCNFELQNCAFVWQFARVLILSLALVIFVTSSMASRQTNNSMDAAFSALNVSSAPSAITSTSVVATSLPNLSVPISAPLAGSSSVADPGSSVVLAPEIVALVSQTVQAALQASQFHPSPAIASSVPASAARSSSDTLNGSAAAFLASGTGFQQAQSSVTTQGRNIPIVVPSFVSTFNAPVSALASSSAHVTSGFSPPSEAFQVSHTQSSALADRPFVVGPGFSPVPGKLVSQILRGTYVNLSELLSVNLVCSDPEPHLMLDGRLVLTAPPKKQRRQIADITSWTEAFTVFSLVLTSSFPHRWKDLTLYKLLILRIHRQFSGRVWLAYDKAFREHAAATGLFDWSLMNAQLFNFHAAGASLRSSSSSSGEFSEPSGSSSSRIACISWNKGLCTAPFTSCRYYHRCSRCGGSHRAISCSSRREQRLDDISKRRSRSPAAVSPAIGNMERY